MGLANMEALILLLRSPYTVSSAMLSQKGIAVRASIATARRREHADLQAGHLSRPQPRPSKSSRSRSCHGATNVALFLGPRLAGYSAVNVEDLTTVELRSRKLAVGHLEMYRAAALGFSDAFPMLGAPQIGFATAGGSPACAR